MATKAQLDAWKKEHADTVEFLTFKARTHDGVLYVDSNAAPMAANRSQQHLNSERKDGNIRYLQVLADDTEDGKAFAGWSHGYWYSLEDCFDIAATPGTRNVTMLTISDGVKVRFNKPSKEVDHLSKIKQLEEAFLNAFVTVYGETTTNESGQHQSADGTRFWSNLVETYVARTK